MLPTNLQSPQVLLKRFKVAKDRRNSSWWSHLQEAYDYAAPQRETLNSHTPGQKKNVDIFDNTAITGLQTFANRMQKAVVPPWQKWDKLVPGTDVPEEQHEAMVEYEGEEMTLIAALEEITDRVFEYIHRSNFSSRIYEAFIDFGISTGTITCEYDARRDELVFNSVPLSQLYLLPGPNGQVGDHWREHDVEGEHIYALWPESEIDEETQRVIKEKPQQKHQVVEGCLESDGTYYYVVILVKKKQLIFWQDAGETSPFISFRGMVVPGEVYGRGPILQVLTDIKTLNVVKEFELTAAAIAASGAWTGRNDGVFNPYTVQVAPGVVIPVGSNDTGNPTIAALPMNFDFNVNHIVAEELRNSINKALFAEPLGQMDDPTKTATEMQIRYQMHLEEAGAFFARLQTELVEKLTTRVVYLLQREGKIPPIKVDGRDVAVKHTSPIARVMDMEDLQNLQMALGEVAMLGEEAITMTFDTDEVGKYIAKKRSIDPDLIRTDQERQQLKQQMAAAVQQAQQAAQQQASGQGNAGSRGPSSAG